MIVPAYVLSNEKQGGATLDAEGRSGTTIAETAALQARDIELPEGRWRLEDIRASGPRPQVQLFSRDDHRYVPSDEPIHGRVDFTIRAPAGALHLRELVFGRVGDPS